jgi:hypothetical protein
MQTQTLGIHQGTYDALFCHPVARNLQWRDVRSMLSSVAEVTEEHGGGNVKFTRNGQTLTVHPPRRKDFSDVQELMHIRQFLERSGAPSQAAVPDGVHLLVVIDHREARIFRAELRGSVPERITPYDPYGSRRHLRHVEEDDASGRRKGELNTFYEAVARTLAGAERILILGSSTGGSSAMVHLAGELKRRHPELARRVSGTLVVDGGHMTDNQLLAKAREVYARGAAQ